MHSNNGSIHMFNLLLIEGLGQVHLACKSLPYGHMDQTLLIDDEPSKAHRIQNGVDFSSNHSKDVGYPNTRCNC